MRAVSVFPLDEFRLALKKVYGAAAPKGPFTALSQATLFFSRNSCTIACCNLNQWCQATIPAQGDEFSLTLYDTQRLLDACAYFSGELHLEYQTCASRRQIDTLLQNYLDTMQAVKAARGRIYFIPRDYMPKLALFEDFIALLEQHNQHKYADRLPLDANSMFVVDDEKQRSKMALAFYRTIQKDLAEYEKRATHLIQSGNQSPAIMDRMVLSIRELERKKIYYESILKQELHEVDEQYTSLRYLSDELQIRARSIQAQKRLAA